MTLTGVLNLGPPDHPAIHGVVESVTQHSLPHARLSVDDVRARFPALVPNESDVGVYEEDGGYLRVEACTRAHARLAVKRGADLRTRTKVVSLQIAASSIRATLENGDVVEAKKLVVAAGAWLASHELARGLPPLVVERQVQLWFRPVRADDARAPKMPAFIHFTGDRAFYGIPIAEPLPITSREPGLKVCRHHGGEQTTADALDRDVRDSDVDEVRAYLRAHLPNGDGPVLLSRVCMYTSTPDDDFVVGFHPRHPNVVVLGGFLGHGYKMAPVMGEIAADLVEHGASRFDLGLFDPSR
jgi:sarcosine oxidase